MPNVGGGMGGGGEEGNLQVMGMVMENLSNLQQLINQLRFYQDFYYVSTVKHIYQAQDKPMPKELIEQYENLGKIHIQMVAKQQQQNREAQIQNILNENQLLKQKVQELETNKPKIIDIKKDKKQ